MKRPHGLSAAIGLLLLVRDIHGYVFQTAVQDGAQLIQRVRRDWHIRLEALDGGVTHAMLEAQGIGRYLLVGHSFPQRRIADHHNHPLYSPYYG